MQCTDLQVRVVLNRNADLRMIGGRNEMDAEFDVGFDDEGRCAHRPCLARSLLADPCPFRKCTLLSPDSVTFEGSGMCME